MYKIKIGYLGEDVNIQIQGKLKKWHQMVLDRRTVEWYYPRRTPQGAKPLRSRGVVA